ncbi:hypothetical protein AGMMS50230_05410 [Spirochaetia bacterium]|nr:hypothetical protein AGMMS50230_05410 [Spirochaetia bacterium]
MWKKAGKRKLPAVEAFLRRRECFCVGAVSRFLGGPDYIWTAPSARQDHAGQDQLAALLLYCRQLLFPVFNLSPPEAAEFRMTGMPLPSFFSLVLLTMPLHAMQGLAEDMDLLEITLEKRKILPAVKFDYELRSFEADPENPPPVPKGPPGLIIRKSEPEDINGLFPLQAAYEKEEVLPPGAEFNPAVCLKGLEYLVAGNKTLTAELDGMLVGKININAQSFNRFQIGGVYVLPEFRNLGIARIMTVSLIRELSSRKKDFTLFVKKANAPARKVYDKIGFAKIGDYRINYYL